MDPILAEVNEKFQNSLDHLKRELSSIRAGRANPAILEELPVMAYGTRMKLMEVGTISAPQPSLLTVQVWDPAVIRDVEKAITESKLGFNPAVDGQLIRISIPPLTAERREEFVKVAHQKGEECRVSIRQARQEQKEDWSKQKEAGTISEDDFFRYEKQMQDLVEKANAEVDTLVKAKEEDLREI
jgi:ribosome recycling factor